MILKTMIRKYKTALIVVAVLVSIVGIASFSLRPDKEDTETEKTYIPSVETAIVAPGLSREIATTGEVQSAKSATLTAEVRADVRSVLVKVGDEVRVGQTLIQLTSASVNSTRSTAGAAYVNAQNSLTQTQLSAEKSIESARVALDTAEISLTNTLAQNEALRRQAEETLNASKLSSGLSVSSAQTTLDNAIRSAYPTADAAVAACDEIIGVSPAYSNANDSYEHLLGAFKNTAKPAAENAITIALQKLGSLPENYVSAHELLEAAKSVTLTTLDVLNNSNVGVDYTQTTLNSDISTVNTQLSNVQTAISTLDSAQAALESAEQDSNGTSQAVLSAQAAYEATIAQLDANEKSARQSVASAQAALESAQKSAELTQTSARASLTSAAGNLNQAQISQGKLTVRAPFSGKVTAVEVEPGDEVNAGATLVRVEDDSSLKIVAYLSADEVRKVNINDEVKIAKKSLDTVSAIAPAADPITKKFEVEILHQNPYLQSGEFVKLRFQVGEEAFGDSRIFLPINAINILSYGSFVWKMEEGKAIKQEVVLGEIEGEFVEILSGLELGEEVIVAGGRILDVSRNDVEVEVIGE